MNTSEVYFHPRSHDNTSHSDRLSRTANLVQHMLSLMFLMKVTLYAGLAKGF